MIINLLRGAKYVFKGMGLLKEKDIRRFVIVPLFVNVILFSLGLWFAFTQLDSWLSRILPDYLAWLEWLLIPIFSIVLLFLVFYTFSVIANLIAAPFNSILAERVEAKVLGVPAHQFDGYKQIPRLLVKTFKSETQKLLYMGKWFLVLILLTFIPGLNLLSPLAWLLFGAWMLAVEYFDYPMGNHNVFFKEELAQLKKYKSISLGFGGNLLFLNSIPIINFLAMPVGVIGATLIFVDHINKGD